MKKSYKVASILGVLVFVISLMAAALIMMNNRIAYAATATTVPNDTYYTEQWALHGEYGIDIEGAWEISKGSSSVRVGIIDSGINAHEDIDVQNVDEGYDFYNNNIITDDALGAHGTFVAGVIGAKIDNNIYPALLIM